MVLRRWNQSWLTKVGYDPNGNRSSLRKRDGKVIHSAHDALNREIRTWYTGVTQAEVHRTYDLAGRPEWVRFDSPSGPGIQYQYNPAKQSSSPRNFRFLAASFTLQQSPSIWSIMRGLRSLPG